MFNGTNNNQFLGVGLPPHQQPPQQPQQPLNNIFIKVENDQNHQQQNNQFYNSTAPPTNGISSSSNNNNSSSITGSSELCFLQDLQQNMFSPGAPNNIQSHIDILSNSGNSLFSGLTMFSNLNSPPQPLPLPLSQVTVTPPTLPITNINSSVNINVNGNGNVNGHPGSNGTEQLVKATPIIIPNINTPIPQPPSSTTIATSVIPTQNGSIDHIDMNDQQQQTSDKLVGAKRVDLTSSTSSMNESTTSSSTTNSNGHIKKRRYVIDQNHIFHWTPYCPNYWHRITSPFGVDLRPPTLIVLAEKGFSYSEVDSSWVYYRRNHFQLGVSIQHHFTIDDNNRPMIEINSVSYPVDSLNIGIRGIKNDGGIGNPAEEISVELYQTNSKREKNEEKAPPLIPITNLNSVSIPRLHFRKATSNNARKHKLPNPQQEYFRLVLTVSARSQQRDFSIISLISDPLIVRTGHPTLTFVPTKSTSSSSSSSSNNTNNTTIATTNNNNNNSIVPEDGISSSSSSSPLIGLQSLQPPSQFSPLAAQSPRILQTNAHPQPPPVFTLVQHHNSPSTSIQTVTLSPLNASSNQIPPPPSSQPLHNTTAAPSSTITSTPTLQQPLFNFGNNNIIIPTSAPSSLIISPVSPSSPLKNQDESTTANVSSTSTATTTTLQPQSVYHSPPSSSHNSPDQDQFNGQHHQQIIQPQPQQVIYHPLQQQIIQQSTPSSSTTDMENESSPISTATAGSFHDGGAQVWDQNQRGGIYRYGNVGINNSEPNESLSVHGNIAVTGTTYNPSDRRVKKNIKPVSTKEQLDKIKKLQLYDYQLTDQWAKDTGITEKNERGVLAQELREVIPNAVKETGDRELSDGTVIKDFLMINKDAIFMENVGATQELSKKVDNVCIELDNLDKKKIEVLGNKVGELEQQTIREIEKNRKRKKIFITVGIITVFLILSLVTLSVVLGTLKPGVGDVNIPSTGGFLNTDSSCDTSLCNSTTTTTTTTGGSTTGGSATTTTTTTSSSQTTTTTTTAGGTTTNGPITNPATALSTIVSTPPSNDLSPSSPSTLISLSQHLLNLFIGT